MAASESDREQEKTDTDDGGGGDDDGINDPLTRSDVEAPRRPFGDTGEG